MAINNYKKENIYLLLQTQYFQSGKPHTFTLLSKDEITSCVSTSAHCLQSLFLKKIIFLGFETRNTKHGRLYRSVPGHTSPAICWSAGIVSHFTYKCETDWAIEFENGDWFMKRHLLRLSGWKMSPFFLTGSEAVVCNKYSKCLSILE